MSSGYCLPPAKRSRTPLILKFHFKYGGDKEAKYVGTYHVFSNSSKLVAIGYILLTIRHHFQNYVYYLLYLRWQITKIIYQKQFPVYRNIVIKSTRQELGAIKHDPTVKKCENVQLFLNSINIQSLLRLFMSFVELLP